ncbi:methyltransferase family protein [Mumia flava]|uniref:Methyltransferase family protein n=1 Tax=Mumia flava TaxID=1348852 RepID=A0A0B2BAT6_9ACTN|nr:class I SAM-dependent methyltransferase [Mumia flava]PJJ56169.1 methyltransferase family protein [Mumia flava]
MSDSAVDRLFDSILGAFDVLTIALGDRLGLYDVLHAHGPITAPALAEHAGIDPRYAREWVEQQCVAGWVGVDDPGAAADERRYSLTPDAAETLRDRDSEDYLAAITQIVAAAAAQLPALAEAYRTGGGVPWAQYGPAMRRGQADGNRPLYLGSMTRAWLPSLPELHERLRAGTRVADIGCGDGWGSIAIARAYPDVTVDGYDVDPDSIAAAQANARDSGVADRATFHQVDATRPPQVQEYGLVTAFECIHDLPDPVSVLAGMRGMAQPDGWVLVMDERVPDAFTGPGDDVERLMYGYSTLICLPDAMAHRPTRATGTVMRLDVLRRYAQEAGFVDVEVLPIEHDVFRLYRLLS